MHENTKPIAITVREESEETPTETRRFFKQNSWVIIQMSPK